MIKERILLVEDDETLGYILTEYLELKQYEVIWSKNGREGLANLNDRPFDLCILDVMMPEMDGFEMAKRARESAIDVPIIFLTARSLKIDKLKGFNLGADDYITKPVEEEELLARIRAILRRVANAQHPFHAADRGVTHFGDCTLGSSERKLSCPAGTFTLTEKECRLLEMLVINENSLLLRADALKTIWGSNDYFARKSMDVHIHKLRKTLNSSKLIKIVNIHGKGFVLRVES